MVFNIIVGIFMAAAFVGMIMCAKKQHVNSVAKPAAIGLLVVVVICAILILSKNMGSGDTKALIANEMKYAKSSTYVLGQELAKLKPGAKVLVVVGKQDDSNTRQKIIIEGLKEGFGETITDVRIETPPVKMPKASTGDEYDDEMMSIEELMTANDFNTMLAKNKGRDLIITTIGLPQDARNLKLWNEFSKNPKKCPKLVMVGGDISRLGPFLQAGLILAVVTYSPEAVYDEDAAPSDMKAAFDKRYLLITKANLAEITQKYPERIFRTPK